MDDQPKPEFIIIGGMKCGTSSLHRALEQHPRVFIPEGEMKYYSVDDLEQNTTFFRHQENQWIAQNFAENHAASLTLYQQRYLNCPRDSIAGEDAPSYLAITEVAKRLHENLPEVKLIVTLRDPVARTYSHYWHNVASFRAHYDFEDSLRFAQENLLRRSFYKEQIETYLRYFPREQMHFVIFEEFVSEQQKVLSGVLDFLGLDAHEFQPVHANMTSFPRRLHLTLKRNYLFRDAIGFKYRGIIPGFDQLRQLNLKERIAYKIDSILNNYSSENRPELREETKALLESYLRRKNEGLAELIGNDLSVYWKMFSEK